MQHVIVDELYHHPAQVHHHVHEDVPGGHDVVTIQFQCHHWIGHKILRYFDVQHVIVDELYHHPLQVHHHVHEDVPEGHDVVTIQFLMKF